MARKTFGDLYDASVHEWIGTGNGLVVALGLLRTVSAARRYAFAAWTWDRVFDCAHCGNRFSVLDSEAVGEDDEILCEHCQVQ